MKLYGVMIQALFWNHNIVRPKYVDTVEVVLRHFHKTTIRAARCGSLLKGLRLSYA
jgi:hypothetical protein